MRWRGRGLSEHKVLFCHASKDMREREREREQLLMLIRFPCTILHCTVLYVTAEERAIPHDAHGKTLRFGRSMSTVGSKEA
jgi:hypothetical protein